MRVHILGSGAGGGLPQWNCACDNCSLVRAGDPSIAPRTQDSIAVSRGSSDDERWLVVNASPDVLRQIEGFASLWPRAARHTPIGAIALTNGDLDHVVGLLSLRESQPLRILATPQVRSGLVDRNAVLRTLARSADQVTWITLDLGREVRLEDLGLGVTAVPVAGKLPVHLVGLGDPSPEDNVALRVRDLGSGRTVVIATAMGSLEAAGPLSEHADALLLDGTFWSQDELVALGLGKAHARDMAHVPVGGADGSLARLGPALPGGGRRIYTHINNTNPMLRAGSRERTEVERAGWEIAFDGMDFTL